MLWKHIWSVINYGSTFKLACSRQYLTGFKYWNNIFSHDDLQEMTLRSYCRETHINLHGIYVVLTGIVILYTTTS